MNPKICFLCSLLLATPAHAVNCYPIVEMIDMLQAVGQKPWEGGMRDSGHAVMIWVNPETRDWTATERREDHLCITSAGQGWERRKPEPAGKPS